MNPRVSSSTPGSSWPHVEVSFTAGVQTTISLSGSIKYVIIIYLFLLFHVTDEGLSAFDLMTGHRRPEDQILIKSCGSAQQTAGCRRRPTLTFTSRLRGFTAADTLP